MHLGRTAAVSIAIAMIASLAACGGDDASSTELNDADVEFAQGMIAHHEQAVEMSEIALDPTVGAGTDVVDLATRIMAAQEPEIEQMTAWLTAAGESITMDMSDGHDMSEMEGMMSVEQMDALVAATGPEFDRMWLEMMIEHHEGAISQAETVIADGSNSDVRALADEIIAVQQTEIDEMRALLGG
jgi:uncharacterized protein (DUF305 family)